MYYIDPNDSTWMAEIIKNFTSDNTLVILRSTRFNTQKLYAVSIEWISEFRMDLRRKNSSIN
jgi:hypothetical protein